MLAIVAGHEQVARTLVHAGADLTIRGSGAPELLRGARGPAELQQPRWLPCQALLKTPNARSMTISRIAPITATTKRNAPPVAAIPIMPASQ